MLPDCEATKSKDNFTKMIVSRQASAKIVEEVQRGRRIQFLFWMS